VPRIGFDVHMCPFPGSLHACLEYLGDPCDYDYLMGVTGAAFRRLWNRDDGGNVDLSYLGDEPFRRAFEALGHEAQQGLSEASTRREFAAHICAARTKEAKAVAHLEHALAGLR
jgi:hypothetical protein